MDSFFIYLLTLAVGAGGGWALYHFTRRQPDQASTRDVSVLLERIEKVFKVVMSEGYFTEIYNYQNDKNFWQMFNDKKKALVISKAKVLVGYDFGKIRYRVDEDQRKLIIDYFPEPEILSMDTDYKFYDIEQGWLNRFQSEDYTHILTEAKQAMQEKALQSDLPRIATNQLQFMMIQLAAGLNWRMEMQLSEANKKMLDSFTDYKALDAKVKTLRIDEDPTPPTA
jgi:hypothetical protein